MSYRKLAPKLVSAASTAAVILGMGLISMPAANALDNDLAKTPPMGWNSWNQVRCYDLSEEVVKTAIDSIADRGLAEKGYEYVVIDDCWQGGRDPETNKLFSDEKRFPNGIKWLADYAHSRGLKLGIYGVPGDETCANHWDSYKIKNLGSYGYEEIDAKTYEEWGVDYLKYDWCRADETLGLKRQPSFKKMRDELAKLNRPIVYGISEYGDENPWEWGSEVANLWRTTHDIQPTWGSVKHIIDSQAPLAKYSGPGGWNDPDMLQIGNGSFGNKQNPNYLAENRSHFGMWSMLAAPLFLGTDMSRLPDEIVEIVGNEEVVAIDQDALGKQASRIANRNGLEVWARPLANGDTAVALFNSTNRPATVSTTLADLGLEGNSYVARDLWNRRDVANVHDVVGTEVGARDTVIYRLRPGTDKTLPGGVLGVDGSGVVGQGEETSLKVKLSNYTDEALTDLRVEVTGAENAIEVVDGSLNVKRVAGGESATLRVKLRASEDAVKQNYGLPVRVTWQGGEMEGTLNVAVSTATPKGEQNLADIEPLSATSGWASVQRNKSVDGNPLTINGKVYETGYGANSPSDIEFRLGANCKTLTGKLGVDDDTKGGDPKWGHPSINGVISGDGTTLWETSKVLRYQEAEEFTVDVTGVQTLKLHAGIGGDKNAYDHADWVDLHLSCNDEVTTEPEEPQPAPEMELVRAEATAPEAAVFADVAANRMFAGEIAWMREKGISTGWADGTFRPSDQIRRDAMAAFLYRLAGSPEVKTSPRAFKDVPRSHPFYKEIQWMRASGLSTGWDDGTYRPNEPVKRDAMAAFLHRLCTNSPDVCSPAFQDKGMESVPAMQFTDVNEDTVFGADIAWLSRTKVTTGWEDGTFRPNEPITRDAMAAFLYRLVNNQWQEKE
ncbi:NPCBM/NEW2 domain-containing protein [Dermabacteraceae bacterium P13095]